MSGVVARIYRPEDYSTLSSWWDQYRGWKDSKPGPEFLSPLGCVVEIEGKPACAGFLYFTGSALAWLEWLIADRTTDKEKRNEAIDLCIKTLLETASRHEVKAVFTGFRNAALQKRYEKHGFSVTDEGMTHMIRRV